ncbi:MAG: TonB-dependent receptor [Tannerella sp.]|nr:TonB-dependent receptor [Tannerella sp.]
MRYYNILLIFLFCFSISAVAQTTSLTGKVKFNDGNPVPDAIVAIKSLKKYSQTDENGNFKISGVKYGKHEIEVSSIEIKNKSFRIELNRQSQPIVLEVEPSIIEIGQVVVTGRSTKAKMQISGLAVDVLETQKLAVQSVQTNELLDRTAGVKIRQDGGLGSRTRYNINGFSGDAVKIFIDGIPARNYGSSFSLSSIPPALIERIEVYKGVVPGYLGEDALGGAINIVLKKRRKNSLTTSYSFGSFNTHQWNANGSFRSEKGLTFDGSAFYNYSDNDYKVWGDDIYFKDYQGNITESNGKKVRRFNDAYKSAGGKFGIGLTDVKWADQFMVGGVFSKDYKENQHGTTMQVVYGNRHHRRRSNVLTLNYDKKDFLTEGLSLKIETSYSDLKRQNIDTVGIMYDWAGPIRYPDGSYVMYNSGAEANSTSKTAAINREYTYMIRAYLEYRLHENHTIHTNYLFNDFERKVSDEYRPVAQQMLEDIRDLQKHVMAFTYENSLFSEKLRTGIFYKQYIQRVTSHEPYINSDTKEYETTVSKVNMSESGYGLTLSYALFPNLYLLGSAERALRMPNENELFGNTTQDVVAAPELKPEESWNANLGINFNHAIALHSFGINTSVYIRDTRNMIREMFGSRDEWSAFANLEDVETKGIDAEIFYNYDEKLNFRFNISKFNVLFNTKYDYKGHPYNYYRTQIPNEPSFKFNGNISYSLKNILLQKSRLSVYYNVNYVKGFLRNWSNVGSANLKYIPTQYPMDVGMTYAFPGNKIVMNLDAKNISNQQIYDNYGLQKPGRAFYIKLTYFII